MQERNLSERQQHRMRVAIATDTNSSILQGENKDIFVLPMPVIVDGQTYFEGVDICSHELYEAMKQHKDISTSQPAPGQFIELWDQILAGGYDEIAFIPMSSGLSSTCHSAAQLAEDYGGKVQVIDNHRISVTQRESVFASLQLAQQGCSAREIKAYLEARAYEASIYITVDSMEYLKKGGRVTPAAAAFATVLNIKPVLTIQGDKLDTFAKARGMRQAEATMIKAIHQDRATRFADVPDSQLQIETAGTIESEEAAQEWLKMVRGEFPGAAISYYHLPCSIACHLGMNSMAVTITKKEV